MRSTELKNKTATNDRVVERGMTSMAAIAALLLLVSISAAFAGCAPGHTEQQQGHGTAQSATVDWKAVERAMGRSGAMQAGDVYRFGMPRGDLKVVVKGVEIKPALALGSWAAFKMAGNQAMVMGDIVMTEDEVNPVMSRLQQGGIEQTALHNHILNESPRVMYMHIGGHGDPVKLAETISAALKLTKTPPPSAPGGVQSQDGGEQQRVAIARAIVAHPRLLLLDEPMSSLDAELKAELLAELKSLQRLLGVTTIHITHDRAEALSVAQRIWEPAHRMNFLAGVKREPL